MGQNASIPNFAGVTQFKLLQGASLTIPETMDSPSPADASSGVFPTTTFSAKRQGVGGYIYAAFTDAVGPAALDFQYKLRAGDLVAVGAAGATQTISVNGVVVFTMASTAVGGILGYYS